MKLRVTTALSLAAALPALLVCGCADSSSPGDACYTLHLPPNTNDPTGADECELLITTSGPAQCETLYGIMANQPGSCPAARLVGCCVTNIGDEGALSGTKAGVCYYTSQLASTGKAGCNGPNNTWQTTAP